MTDSEDRVEIRLARVEQRVTDLDVRVTSLVPIATNVVQLTERVDTLRRDLAAYAASVSKLDAELAGRELSTQKERRESRRAMLYLTVTILAALISAAAVILTSGAHP